MGYDKSEYHRNCNICGTNYVDKIIYDHDSFNYSYATNYECPTCSEGLYVHKNKKILEDLKNKFATLVENGETYYTKLIESELDLISKVESALKTMAPNRIKQSSSDVEITINNGKSIESGTYYFSLISCYKTKFGLKKDTVYQSLVDRNLYNKSVTLFKKDYKGIDALEVFLKFYGLTTEEYDKYLHLNRNKLNRTIPYHTQYDKLVELIEKAEKDYEQSYTIYHKYHKKVNYRH